MDHKNPCLGDGSELDKETESAYLRVPEQFHPHQQRQDEDDEGWNPPAATADIAFGSSEQEQQEQQEQQQQRSPTSLAESTVAFDEADRAAFQSTMGSILDQGHDLYRSDSHDSNAGFGSDVWRPSSLAPSSSSAAVEDKDDVLELLVQKLQSEIADTRATVLDLENRLTAAECTNKHIVEELKMLLADAEGTLIGSDDSDGGHGTAGSVSKTVEEDANVVYNRICNALQTLITDAQAALARTSTSATGTSSASGSTHALPLTCSASGQCSCQPYQHRLYSTSGNLLLPDGGSSMHSKASSISSRTDLRGHAVDDKDHPYHQHDHHHYHNSNSLQPPPSSRGSRLTTRRSSLAPPHLYVARGSSSSLYPSAPVYQYLATATQQQSEEFSRIRWKEKQQEQYERYRRSCDRVTLELELLLRDTWRAVYDEEAEIQRSQQQQQHRSQQQQQQQQHVHFFSRQKRASRHHERSHPFSSPLSSGASTVVPSLAGSPTAANAPTAAQGYEGGGHKPSLSTSTTSSSLSQEQQDMAAKARAMKARLEKIQRLQRQYLSLSQAAHEDVDEKDFEISSRPLQPLHRHDHHDHYPSPSARSSIMSTDSHSSGRTLTSMTTLLRSHSRGPSSDHSSSSLVTSRANNTTRNVATMPDSPRTLHEDQSLVVQLYGLWRQTALRTRLMHLLTTLVEALVAGWVMVKLAQWALTVCGVQYRQGWLDLKQYLYGDRDGAGGATAKELYLRIRNDSARRRRLVEWRESLAATVARWLTLEPRPSPLSSSSLGGGGSGNGGATGTAEALVSSITQAAAAAAVQDEATQRRVMRALAYPSTRMLTDPVRRVAGHVVSGLLLALVVDQAKRW
ncbi:hypothetical protein BGZ73_001607 [Actinomortierella ambigua]|nr:hypothetical protein BGZ73_001607 [Actinomortierella ambigua]